jgi:hypothetical protein
LIGRIAIFLRLLAVALGVLFCATSVSNAQIFIPIITPAYPQAFPQAQTADYQKIHTVAVISAIGDHISMHGASFWSSKTRNLDLSGWNLDDEIQAQLKKQLSARFSFKEVPFDRAALAKIPNGPLVNYLSGFSGFLQTLPQTDVDAYLIVRRDLEYHMPSIEGLGLEGLENASVLWANYEIDLVDAQSRKLIAKAYSRVR